MDYSFTSDQQLLKNSARAFLDEHCKSAAVRLLWDDPRGESDTMWKEMAQLGWLGLSLPEAYGGSALGMVESAILLEELGRAAYPGPYWPTVLAAAAVESAGTDAQKKRWLSAIATGDARATLAFLDADMDWDPAAMTTRAEKTSNGWALSGTKRFVPWAHVANVLLIPARAPGGPSARRRGRPCSSSTRRRRVSRCRRFRAWTWRRAGCRSTSTRCRWRPTACSAGPARPRRCSRACSAAAPSARRPRCWVRRAAAWTWRSATPRSASSSDSPSARSRRSATSAPRCSWKWRTRTRPSTTPRGPSTRRPRTKCSRRQWQRRTWA